MQNHETFVHLPVEDYEELRGDRKLLNYLIVHADVGVTADPAELERIARVFMERFDPERADEWGHVSFCFSRALRALLGVDHA